MAEVKLTKTELRAQQMRLAQLQKYLPTLQLKKAMLQLEVASAKAELLSAEIAFSAMKEKALRYGYLLEENTAVDFNEALRIREVKKTRENIAGVEFTSLERVDFEPYEYSLVDTPAWVDPLLLRLKEIKIAKIKIAVAHEKKTALENELREVSIRVNLFEKILIPRARGFIKKIKVFLGDQELAAVCQAKVAKELLHAS